MSIAERPVTWAPAKGRSVPTSGRGKRTRDAVLKAAVTVFGASGFSSATMLDIAQEAGVASGTVYQYFSDKADVLRCLLADLEDHLRRETRMPADDRGRLIVRESVLRYLDIYREYAPIYRAWWELIEPPTQFTTAWIATHRSYHGDLKAVITAGQRAGTISDELDPEIAANLIVAMYERPTYVRIVLGWDEDLTDGDVADLMRDLLGGGLVRPAT
ncbi:MAG TPA: TetR/AcrR family transcriptional regulator [Solirubrobacteraceae bacterium]